MLQSSVCFFACINPSSTRLWEMESKVTRDNCTRICEAKIKPDWKGVIDVLKTLQDEEIEIRVFSLKTGSNCTQKKHGATSVIYIYFLYIFAWKRHIWRPKHKKYVLHFNDNSSWKLIVKTCPIMLLDSTVCLITEFMHKWLYMGLTKAVYVKSLKIKSNLVSKS